MPRSGNWRWPTLFWKASSGLGAGNEARYDRTRPSGPVNRPAVRTAVDPAVVVPLCAAGREGAEPCADAVDRRAVPRYAVLRRPTDDLTPAQRWPRSEREVHPSAHAADGPHADLPETQHQQADKRAQDLPLSVARAACGQAKPGPPLIAGSGDCRAAGA